ncbi:SMI1/KNR4 family protein [Nocardiopsis sp. Huas11]|uniref:SMI1/KNR4 family protein n=1 Tax=Nocardiopsis sp. Huas11 TaxID=2183912 RepID=UPI003516FE99
MPVPGSVGCRLTRGAEEDLITINQSSFIPEGFLAVAPVGTGDWWGFPVREGVCTDTMVFLDHGDGMTEELGLDFLEFLVREGLRAS